MFPGMGKMDPKQIQRMMKQFGIKSESIEAEKVIIESKGKKITIKNPNITVIDMQGQKTFTIMGEAEEEKSTSEEDIKLVMEQAKTSREKAIKALEKSNGDIAQAIMEIKNEK